MSSKLPAADFVNNAIVVRRDKTNQINSLNTLYDLNIGVVEKQANIIVSGKAKISGPAYFDGGVIGSLVLPDGSLAVQGSDTVSVTEIAKGKVRLDANFELPNFNTMQALIEECANRITEIETISESQAQDIQRIDACVTSSMQTMESLSGSISTFDGRICSLERYSGGVGTNLAMNVTPAGLIDGANTAFVLPSSPSPASSLMLFKNGQLMSSGSSADYILSCANIDFSFAPEQDDVIFAMYSYQTPVVSYSINEPCNIMFESGSYKIELLNTPNPISSAMIFMNGQLLTLNEDFVINNKSVEFNNSLFDVNSSRFFATYSY